MRVLCLLCVLPTTFYVSCQGSRFSRLLSFFGDCRGITDKAECNASERCIWSVLSEENDAPSLPCYGCFGTEWRNPYEGWDKVRGDEGVVGDSGGYRGLWTDAYRDKGSCMSRSRTPSCEEWESQRLKVGRDKFGGLSPYHICDVLADPLAAATERNLKAAFGILEKRKCVAIDEDTDHFFLVGDCWKDCLEIACSIDGADASEDACCPPSLPMNESTDWDPEETLCMPPESAA
uniref:Uncharacterized protein n=1 Tax=Chromera velia CCMP2878 TaxID=1169474 RepID=A0A0G4F607_9ALVE|eukprot:Cvel_15260.t1-p1 / transcript=Cvel_15260.t1 / gene=Cvel_15260 / organism=Chromera_velia_CCMP2878 / gene_product=hypothetical protein / transcript_product=hypothetical protein / location=Cvel_scaffold1118:47551-50756(-) / protein_length=233 / sequence_SO=supercontig / SO=protein_coding / is_pseudo=false